MESETLIQKFQRAGGQIQIEFSQIARKCISSDDAKDGSNIKYPDDLLNNEKALAKAQLLDIDIDDVRVTLIAPDEKVIADNCQEADIYGKLYGYFKEMEK